MASKNRKEVHETKHSKYWLLPQRSTAEGMLMQYPLSKQQRSSIWCDPSGYSQLNPWKFYHHFSLESGWTRGHASLLVKLQKVRPFFLKKAQLHRKRIATGEKNCYRTSVRKITRACCSRWGKTQSCKQITLQNRFTYRYITIWIQVTAFNEGINSWWILTWQYF